MNPEDALLRPTDPTRAAEPAATGPYHAAADGGEPAAPPLTAGRCRLLGEIARGGMGAVFKAHDPALDRDLAVKVLLERHRDRPELVRRFLEEARIAGRLQHPGVPPVHDVGRMADERPFFAMKLVEGRTLDHLLRERKSPRENLPRFLKVFEQVCQTLAYAHAQRIIHRDLKPLNIMVGAFGEVQIMDWGLAKALPQTEASGSRKQQSETPVDSESSFTLQSSTFPETQAGQVLGTPAYMAPEQARGETDRLDERCDVFGMGAVLCVVLTGRPPYSGRGAEEVVARARQGELADACALLDGCGADAELAALAKACLAAAPDDRPRDGGAVAAAMTAHLAGVQERLRQAEVARAAAQARATEERKRRRLTVTLAATVLLAVSVAAAGGLWVQHDRAVRDAEEVRRTAERARREADVERDATAALDEAEALGARARQTTNDPAKWEATLAEALSAVRRADGLLKSGEGGRALRPRMEALGAELAMAEADRVLIDRLEKARLRNAVPNKANAFDDAGSAAMYAEAFEDDLRLSTLGPEEAAERINRRPIREGLLAALEDWARVTLKPEEADRLRAVVSAADPDLASFRNRCEALLARKDWEGLQRLAFGPEGKDAPTGTLVRVGRRLYGASAWAEAVLFLKQANERRPGDFWVLFELGYALSEGRLTGSNVAVPTDPIAAREMGVSVQPVAADEAIRFFTAALAVRPQSAGAQRSLGIALSEAGRKEEAISEFRAAVKLDPNSAPAHTDLGGALRESGQWDEALAECRRAVELDPNDAECRTNLGAALRFKDRIDDAIAEYRKAVQLNPNLFMAHYNLGIALAAQKQWAEAAMEYRTTLTLKADYAEAWCNLGGVLRAQGRFGESLADYRRGHQLGVLNPRWPYRSGDWVRTAEDLAEREALVGPILRGEAAPADGDQCARFADFCWTNKTFYAASARFYGDALAAAPELAEHPPFGGLRYRAAWAAVAAGCGKGADAATLDEAGRRRWRGRALDWLRTDLGKCTKAIDGGDPGGRRDAANTFRHWKNNPDLAGVREADGLAKLPADEQGAWRRFWADVDAALEKVQAK